MNITNLENKIINADCMDILKQLPDKSVDLVLTDPPYGIGAGDIKFANHKTKNLNKFSIYRNNDWDILPSKDVFKQIFRVSKNQIIWGGNYFVENLCNSKCWIVWDKKTGENTYADCELAFTSFDKPVKKFTKFWLGAHATDGDGRIHPTQKPISLFEFCLKEFTNENDIILDCFSGSGTTAIACHRLNRRFICIEKDKDYYEASVKRLEAAQKQLTLF